MTAFLDKTGHRWTVELTLRTVRRVKAATGIDLLRPDLGTPPLCVSLVTDPLALSDVLGVILGPQMEALKITPEEFEDRIDGAAALACYGAFAEEWIDFFRQSGRTELAKSVEQVTRAVRVTAEKAARKLEQTDVAILADQVLQTTGTPGPT